MLRSIAKTCFAYAYTRAHGSLANFAFRDTPASGPFVVCYHRVVENFDHSRRGAIPSMLISTTMLERHIDWMARRYSFVSLDELGRSLESGRPCAKPVAAITFDDGYSDVYHHAFPLLKRKGIPAAVFVVTGLVGTTRLQTFDELYFVLRSLQSRGASPAQTVFTVLKGAGITIAG